MVQEKNGPNHVLRIHMKDFKKDLEDWHQTQPASEDGTMIQPSPINMTKIWTDVEGGPKKDRTYRFRVHQSSSSPSPLLSNSSSTSQNMKEMKAMRKKIKVLTQQSVANDAKVVKFTKFDELVKKHRPQVFDDEEESEFDDD
ncbi:hypothetical protein P3S68_015503 [Capsicum galapagoense]